MKHTIERPMRKSISLIHTVKISQLSKAIRVLSLIMGLSALATTQTAHASTFKEERDCTRETGLVQGAVNYLYSSRSLTEYGIDLGPYFSEDILKTFTMQPYTSANYWMADPTWLLSSSKQYRGAGELVYKGRLSLNGEPDFFPVIIMDNFHGIADGSAAAPTNVEIWLKKWGGISKTKIKACVIRVARTPLAWKPWSNQEKFIKNQLNAEGLSDAERDRIRREIIPVEWALDSMSQTLPAWPRRDFVGKRIHLKLPRDRKSRLDSIYVVMIKATHNNPYWSPTVEIFVRSKNEYPLK